MEDMASPPRVHLGRIAMLVGAVALTATVSAVSLVQADPAASAGSSRTGAAVVETVSPAVTAATARVEAAATKQATAKQAAPRATAAAKSKPAAKSQPAPKDQPAAKKPAAGPPPPQGSGEGRRIVFDQSDQRVWLIEADETVDRTYLVSGSRFDNLQPGSYSVTSRQRHATSFDYTGSMEYFVRFATGWSAPIGFHSIPVYNNGKPEQTEEQLGEPLSAGCVRQKKSDAKYLWDWAPDGTPVIVTA
ncbi:Lipoprotein-anchoring transpeptidase ErfK/SrfK [Aeromicrobium choanae]|uniref:Lipoprotein-anchoring transpeptidase ErfK/SrfK n=2 Tax=Aeromicrobium choanae TaxID=1736691 RepID=A0A1T4Z4F2_9ACTN|nr:Lipoprotein-anchoring transpeptidase ErfK/SrfK [Aeromicrobium choanae]